MGQLTVITGGARSGKSCFAEQLIAKQCLEIGYIATAQTLDEEMEERVARHQLQRPKHWHTFEEPLSPSLVIAQHGPDYDGILLDCLTILITNIILQERCVNWDNPERAILTHLEHNVLKEMEALQQAARNFHGHLIIVTNEVGLGIVPADPLSRFFRDCCGCANQTMAKAAESVYFVVSGIPMQIKGI